MSSKAYSSEQREAVRAKLLETALDLYSRHGIREVRLMDILQVVGISKPFFYKFFDSVAEFVIEVLNVQWERLYDMMAEADGQDAGIWYENVRFVLDHLIHHREHGLLVMTQEEEVWVRSRVSDELYQSFMTTQISYFEELLKRWDIPQEKCAPELLANMILTIIVTYNSAQRALPFLYLDKLELTAQAQADSLMLYLDHLRSKSVL